MIKKVFSLFTCGFILVFLLTNVFAKEKVFITKNNQEVDRLDGVIALYRPNSNDDADSTYSCAAFAKRYFSSKYGVNLSNLLKNKTPVVSKGKLTIVSSPQKGDLAFWSSQPHSAIVKSTSGKNVILIEQNWKFKDGNSWVTYKERDVPQSGNGVKFYRWSK